MKRVITNQINSHLLKTVNTAVHNECVSSEEERSHCYYMVFFTASRREHLQGKVQINPKGFCQLLFSHIVIAQTFDTYGLATQTGVNIPSVKQNIFRIVNVTRQICLVAIMSLMS